MVRFGDIADLVISDIGRREKPESYRHRIAKCELADRLRNPDMTVVFSDGHERMDMLSVDSPAALSPSAYRPDHIAVEVGWPGLMEDCTFQSYIRRFKRPPEYIFDIGVFLDGRLDGVIEITKSSHIPPAKLWAISNAGLWLADVPADAVWTAIRRSQEPCHMQVHCSKVWVP